MKATGINIGRLVVGCILACSLTSRLLAQSTATNGPNTGLTGAQRAAAEAAQLQLLTQAMAQAEAEAEQARLNHEARQSGALANSTFTSNTGTPAMGVGLNSLTNIWNFGSGGASPKDETNPPPDISNYAKYVAQSFSLIDTNSVTDTNLYNACAGFSDTNTTPLLQIAQYEPGCLVIKASHFDYSSESRNFCVVVCDKLDTPLYKNMDLIVPSNNVENGGWLVQGSVPAWQVADPMYLVVSNFYCLQRVLPGRSIQWPSRDI